ncbi:MAG: tRNA (adenosine(37)-N6)-dimethylallyltransferase MiaA [Dehalococcoidia bacterium]|tara:strand:+ start:958 stop:1878 length:921 start_codon:yes stop_codon:yes gene_type:complete
MQINSLVILGPTATGKTQLSLKLSQYFDSEIINCDTSIFYKYLSIGTGKPSKKNLKLVKHNLLDFLEPDQDYSLAEFLKDANKIISQIVSDKKVPILVGGSGQYLKALTENWDVSNIKPNLELRKKLEKEINEKGVEHLYEKLKSEFPENAQKVDSKNPRRIIRAFELGLEGKTISRKSKKNFSNFFKIGLTMPRETLYKTIDERIEKMFEDGWVGEVEELIKKGFNKELNSFSSIGYNEIYDYLSNNLDLDEAINLIKKRTRNLVRHQYNWFKLNDPEIKWFDSSKHSINYISEKILKEKIENKF